MDGWIASGMNKRRHLKARVESLDLKNWKNNQ